MRRFSVPFLFALAFAMVLIMPYGAVGASSPAQSGATVASSVVAPVATLASHAHYWAALQSRLLSQGVSPSVLQRLGSASWSQWSEAVHLWESGASPLSVWKALPQVGIPAIDWGTILTAAVGGCILGATVGAVVGAAAAGIGALPGAGVGCLAGAVAAGITAGAITSWDSVPSQSTIQLTATAAANAYANEIHLEASQMWSTANMTAQTEYYYYRLAAFAALGQLENSTFNQTQDLIVSTIPAQFSSLFGAYYGTLDNAASQLVSAAAATGGGEAIFEGNNGVGYATFEPTSLQLSMGANLTGSQYVYLPPATLGTVLISPTAGTCSTNTAYFNATYYAYGSGELSLETSPSVVGNDVGYVRCLGTIGTHQGLFVTDLSPVTQAFVAASPFCLPTVSCSVPPSAGDGGTFLYACFGPPSSGEYTNNQNPDSCTQISLTSNGFVQEWDAVNALESNAVAEGQAYWQELRNLGYTNADQLPPQYLIPPPFGALPPNLCVFSNPIVLPNDTIPGSCTTNLNQTEVESLYFAYLQGMALFFNSTTYLEHQPRPCDALGCAPWGNLNTYTVGDIYIPGAKNSTGAGAEVYGNVSTWNVTHDQLLLMPELNPLKVPVGQVVDIPSNAPLEVYVVQRGEDLSLTGNGSAVAPVSSVHVLSVAPGDAIYLQYCQTQGVPQSNCTLTVTTINDTATSITCVTATSGSGGSCPALSSGGGAFSFGGLLSAIGGAICSLTGGLVCGSPAQTLAGVLVAIAVLVIVAVAAIAVIRYASGGSSRAVELRVSGKGGRK